MIKVEHISKSYGNIQILSDISFTLHKGDIVGLLGVNGAGKSTLIKILTGILRADRGQLNLFGSNLDKDSLKIKSDIGYLSEDNPLYEDLYVKEYLEYVADIYKVHRDEISRVIDLTGLGNEYKKKIKVLSKGNRQRVGIAQVLIHNPQFLILDEPTSGLDPNQRESFNKLFIELSKNRIVLFSSHLLEEVAAVCTRFILLDKGAIVADENIQNIDSIKNTFHQLTYENSSR